MKRNNSGSTGRKRTCVGATNRRPSAIPSKYPENLTIQESSDWRRNGIPSCRKNSTSIKLMRPASSTKSEAPAATNRSQALVKASNHMMEALSTSRSMPALGTAAARSAFMGARGETICSVNPTREDSAAQQMGPEDRVEGNCPQAPVDDFYLSSTQLAYMPGLHPSEGSESTVPILDPYLYRSLLHDRWINRACQWLGQLANTKYGSVREFFRVYDSNCDGVLDFDEFSKGITMCQLDNFFPRSLQRALFDRMDTDKSGSVELDEFVKFLDRTIAQSKGVPLGVSNAWQRQELVRKTDDLEARSAQLQPIHDHRTQRIKNKLSYCLSKMVPNASAGLADSRAMFLKKEFALLHEDASKRDINGEDLARALGSRGMNLGVSEDDLRMLMREIGSSGDGLVKVKEFAAFLNLDDHNPLYHPLFDSRRRAVNIMQSFVDSPPPTETPEELYIKERVEQLHLAAVPSKTLDPAVRIERSKRNPFTEKDKKVRKIDRLESPRWMVTKDSVKLATLSGREIVDVWDLPPSTRHLSSTKRSLTSSMRSLPRSVVTTTDGTNLSFADVGGPFEIPSLLEMAPSYKDEQERLLSTISYSSQDLFTSLKEARSKEAAASAMSRSRKVPKSTWADIGHGGHGEDAGTDESSSYYACPEKRFTTTNSERLGPLIPEKAIEKGRRSGWFYRQRPGDSAVEASSRQKRCEIRSNKIRGHLERIALSVKSEEVSVRLKEERRVRGKTRARLRYLKWVKSLDTWLSDEAPRLADFSKRQFPQQNIRLRGGQQVHEALGGPTAR